MKHSTLWALGLIILFWGCSDSEESAKTNVSVTDTKSASNPDTGLTENQSDTTVRASDSGDSNDVGTVGEDAEQTDTSQPTPMDTEQTDDLNNENVGVPDSATPTPKDTGATSADDTTNPSNSDTSQTTGQDTTTPIEADTATPSEEDTVMPPTTDIGPPDNNDVGQPEPIDAGAIPPTCPAPVVITKPAANDFFALKTPIVFVAKLDELGPDGSALTVQWEDAKGSALGTSELQADGTTQFTTENLSAGAQEIVARLVVDGAPCEAATPIVVNLCVQELSENFDAALDKNSWKIHGAAYWDTGGWLEMTGVQKAKQGAIYNTQTYIEPGNVSIRFSLATGGGSNPGADGFAMTTVEADSVDELTTLVKTADSGGGLGYGVAGNYGNWKGNAFTVEIDTWYNKKNPGMTEKHTDPTKEDHIGITLDGDPGNHIAWTEVPDVENLKWHDVRVDVVGTKLTVKYNGEAKVQSDVAELEYRGGYIFFSGSTGYYTNYHRFDNLKILHQCQ